MSDEFISYRQRFSDWQKAKFAPPPEKPLTPTTPSIVEMVPMRDGVHLYTEIFLPKFSGVAGLPIVFVRSPYPYSIPSRNDKRPIQRYLDAGYGFVFQLTRGQGLSQGIFQMFVDDERDGADSVDWIAGQEWCNGNIGMEGASYSGTVQLLAARAKPSALKCIMPTAFVGNCLRSFPYGNGVLNKGPFMQWLQVVDARSWDDLDVDYCDMAAIEHPNWGPAFRHRPSLDAADNVISGDKLICWRDSVSHQLDDEYWSDVHFTDKQLAEIEIPMFFTDGWYDMTIGPIDFFSRLNRIRTKAPNIYLLVGPWDHYQTAANSKPGDDNGDRVLPVNGALDFMALRISFFDRFLKGDEADFIQDSSAKVYISGNSTSGASNWFNFSTFPPANSSYCPFYLHSNGDARSYPGDGTLGWDEPRKEPVDCYIYDPAVPTSAQAESFKDRRGMEIRSDVLTYTSAPLERPLTILGEIVLVLHAASDARDTDWFAFITEVLPGGQSKSFHYAPPGFRARYRDGFDRELLLEPNCPYEFHIPMGPAGHQIAAGNRLRLSVFSSAFPEYEPNTNTGEPNFLDSGKQQRAARQTIYHDAERSSHVLLPVIELSR